MTNTIEIENLNISDLDIPKDETLQEVATACEGIATSSEGIATSCDNVATSCSDLAKDITLQSTNNALGSLATDATLQATNTALGSISGSLSGFATDTTLQAVKGSIDSVASTEGTLNTTLGAVAKDSTLQSTNAALGSLAADATLHATNTALGSLMADTTGQSIAAAISGLGATLGSDRALIDGSNIGNKATFRQNIGLTTGSAELTSPASQVYRQYINKLYGVVYLYLDINNFTSTTPQTIGFLPEGFRPYHRILTDVIVIYANDNSFKGYAHFVTQPTGEITLQMQGNYTYPFCTLDISFPISSS